MYISVNAIGLVHKDTKIDTGRMLWINIVWGGVPLTRTFPFDVWDDVVPHRPVKRLKTCHPGRGWPRPASRVTAASLEDGGECIKEFSSTLSWKPIHFDPLVIPKWTYRVCMWSGGNPATQIFLWTRKAFWNLECHLYWIDHNWCSQVSESYLQLSDIAQLKY